MDLDSDPHICHVLPCQVFNHKELEFPHLEMAMTHTLFTGFTKRFGDSACKEPELSTRHIGS